ncbi:efflux RND transporter periplasmic adaptor subunit [Alkaliphilus serpentinus]|nr:efflux RND transporter periplasmic adaptor subunit [Alkaliphilus serpentinus]
MTKKGKKRLITVIVILLVLGGISAAAVSASKGSKAGITVDAITIDKGDIFVKVPANGVLEEVEKTMIFHEGNSRVETIEVEVGDTVEEGQVLATLDTAEMGNQLEIAEVQLEMERISLVKLEEARVEAMKDLEKNIQDAEALLERNKEIYNSGGISKVELENSEKSYSELMDTYQQYEENSDSMYFDIERLKKQIRVSELNIQDIKRNITKMEEAIVATVSGTITQVNLQQGAITNPAQPGFVISDTNNLEIQIHVNEYDINKVKLGQKVEIEAEALPSVVFNGVVEKISPVATRMASGQTSETVVLVTIKVSDQHEMLKPGFSAKTRIISEEKLDTIVVPFDSIVYEQDNLEVKYVFVVANDKLEKREIKTGVESDFHVEVAEGLEVGDKIVQRPTTSLKEGTTVMVREVENK